MAWVLLIEGDARITAALEKQAGGLAALRQAPGGASRTTSVWCGYNRANSWPVWGAHALAVSRSSCRSRLARTEWEYQNAGYYALDTYYSCLWWQGEVEISHTKVVRQRRHKLAGRRRLRRQCAGRSAGAPVSDSVPLRSACRGQGMG